MVMLKILSRSAFDGQCRTTVLSHAQTADPHQRLVTGTQQPEHARHLPVCRRTVVITGGMEIMRQRQNAVLADQSTDLRAERHEGGNIDERQQRQKGGGGDAMGRRQASGTP